MEPDEKDDSLPPIQESPPAVVRRKERTTTMESFDLQRLMQDVGEEDDNDSLASSKSSEEHFDDVLESFNQMVRRRSELTPFPSSQSAQRLQSALARIASVEEHGEESSLPSARENNEGITMGDGDSSNEKVSQCAEPVVPSVSVAVNVSTGAVHAEERAESEREVEVSNSLTTNDPIDMAVETRETERSTGDVESDEKHCEETADAEATNVAMEMASEAKIEVDTTSQVQTPTQQNTLNDQQSEQGEEREKPLPLLMRCIEDSSVQRQREFLNLCVNRLRASCVDVLRDAPILERELHAQCEALSKCSLALERFSVGEEKSGRDTTRITTPSDFSSRFLQLRHERVLSDEDRPRLVSLLQRNEQRLRRRLQRLTEVSKNFYDSVEQKIVALSLLHNESASKSNKITMSDVIDFLREDNDKDSHSRKIAKPPRPHFDDLIAGKMRRDEALSLRNSAHRLLEQHLQRQVQHLQEMASNLDASHLESDEEDVENEGDDVSELSEGPTPKKKANGSNRRTNSALSIRVSLSPHKGPRPSSSQRSTARTSVERHSQESLPGPSLRSARKSQRAATASRHRAQNHELLGGLDLSQSLSPFVLKESFPLGKSRSEPEKLTTMELKTAMQKLGYVNISAQGTGLGSRKVISSLKFTGQPTKQFALTKDTIAQYEFSPRRVNEFFRHHPIDLALKQQMMDRNRHLSPPKNRPASNTTLNASSSNLDDFLLGKLGKKEHSRTSSDVSPSKMKSPFKPKSPLEEKDTESDALQLFTLEASLAALDAEKMQKKINRNRSATFIFPAVEDTSPMERGKELQLSERDQDEMMILEFETREDNPPTTQEPEPQPQNPFEELEKNVRKHLLTSGCSETDSNQLTLDTGIATNFIQSSAGDKISQTSSHRREIELLNSQVVSLMSSLKTLLTNDVHQSFLVALRSKLLAQEAELEIVETVVKRQLESLRSLAFGLLTLPVDISEERFFAQDRPPLGHYQVKKEPFSLEEQRLEMLWRSTAYLRRQLHIATLNLLEIIEADCLHVFVFMIALEIGYLRMKTITEEQKDVPRVRHALIMLQGQPIGAFASMGLEKIDHEDLDEFKDTIKAKLFKEVIRSMDAEAKAALRDAKDTSKLVCDYR